MGHWLMKSEPDAFGAQQVAAVPVAAHDVRLDAVVTEQGLRRFR